MGLTLNYSSAMALDESNQIAPGNKYNCDKCSKSFSKKYYLTNHREIVHDGIIKFKCEKCEKSFATRGSLSRHSQVHSDVKNYKCFQCQAFFARTDDF